jgi:unsaturated rhamnogalacturonyl hydrolase
LTDETSLSTIAASDEVADLLRRAAERTMRFDFTEWFWGDPIAVEGLLEAAVLLGDDRFQDRASAFARPWCERGTVHWNDANAPGRAFNDLYRRTGDRVYLDGSLRLADHLINRVPRSLEPECPIYTPDRVTHRAYAWVDSIYHVPPYFADLARLTGDGAYLEHALYVLDAHVACLLDEATGLFSQGRDLASDVTKGLGWGRGMAWAYGGIVDTLEMLDQGADRERLTALLRRLTDVLLPLQTSSGAWRNLVQDGQAPVEGSTAALIGAGLEKGLRLGVLDESARPAIERAWEHVLAHVDGEGGLFDVSACSWVANNPGDDRDVYRAIGFEVNVWGQGALLRACAERLLRA